LNNSILSLHHTTNKINKNSEMILLGICNTEI
jgi:hypothetical protein